MFSDSPTVNAYHNNHCADTTFQRILCCMSTCNGIGNTVNYQFCLVLNCSVLVSLRLKNKIAEKFFSGYLDVFVLTRIYAKNGKE